VGLAGEAAGRMISKFGTTWLLLTTIFFLTCYAVIWVADDFAFEAMKDSFFGDDILGYVSMMLCLCPGVAALALGRLTTER
jgi:hypothetical protein